MAIVDRAQVRPGVTLIGKLKGVEYACRVKEAPGGAEGAVFVLDRKQVPDGTILTHKTPSGAAQAVMGGIAANGWRFWSIKGGEQDPAAFAAANPGAAPAPAPQTRGTKAKAETAEPQAPKVRRPRKKAPHKIIKPTASQADVPEGAVRYCCDADMQTFVAVPAEDGSAPACPNGHHNDDPEFQNLNGGNADETAA